jgi:hypothetical protein
MALIKERQEVSVSEAYSDQRSLLVSDPSLAPRATSSPRWSGQPLPIARGACRQVRTAPATSGWKSGGQRVCSSYLAPDIRRFELGVAASACSGACGERERVAAEPLQPVSTVVPDERGELRRDRVERLREPLRRLGTRLVER